jgi:hypothetical protein
VALALSRQCYHTVQITNFSGTSLLNVNVSRGRDVFAKTTLFADFSSDDLNRLAACSAVDFQIHSLEIRRRSKHFAWPYHLAMNQASHRKPINATF